MWQCSFCSLECAERVTPGVCPRCFKVDCYIRPRTYKPARQVSLIPDVDLPRIKTGETDVDMILHGGFVEASRVLLWGRGGTGKSRLAMRWSTGHTNALYISLEMYEPIAAHAARSAGADANRLFLTESYDGFARKAKENSCRIVVLDSISVVPRHEQKELLEDLTKWVERLNTLVIVICHQTKRGQHAGSHAIQHWGDTELFLKHSKTGAVIVEVLKSRGSPNGKCKTTLGNETKEPSGDDAEQENEQNKFPRRRLQAL